VNLREPRYRPTRHRSCTPQRRWPQTAGGPANPLRCGDENEAPSLIRFSLAPQCEVLPTFDCRGDMTHGRKSKPGLNQEIFRKSRYWLDGNFYKRWDSTSIGSCQVLATHPLYVSAWKPLLYPAMAGSAVAASAFFSANEERTRRSALLMSGSSFSQAQVESLPDAMQGRISREPAAIPGADL
jgi:hypothetical protein